MLEYNSFPPPRHVCLKITCCNGLSFEVCTSVSLKAYYNLIHTSLRHMLPGTYDLLGLDT